MTQQRTEYFVWIKSAETVIPVSNSAAKGFLDAGMDGPNLQLLVRTVTVSDFLDRNGDPVTVPTDTNVRAPLNV